MKIITPPRLLKLLLIFFIGYFTFLSHIQAQVVTTLAGTAGSSGSMNGTGAAARFNLPSGVTTDANGNIYVADAVNHTIRKITSGGVVTTFAGTAGSSGSMDGTGVAARFNYPVGVAIDANGNIYVADQNNHIIRKITSGGVVTTLAGTAGSFGSADGTGAAASFDLPTGIVADVSGNVYITDQNNHTIRKITSAGMVTTLAGTAGSSGSMDGTGAAARFDFPVGITIGGDDNFYVTDGRNHTIRKITSAGMVTTFAGTAGSSGSMDGTGAAARFNLPIGITTDASGTIYITDAGNHTIRKITSAGMVTTLAGTPGSNGTTNDMGTCARFDFPSGVTTDASGSIYVADWGNHTIRKITIIYTPPGIDNYWVGCTDSDWNTGSNWSEGTPPAATDVIYVPAGTANDLIIDSPVTCAKFVQQIGAVVKIDYNAGGQLRVTIN